MKCIYCQKKIGKTQINKGMLALHIKFNHPDEWKGRLKSYQIGK